MQLPNNIGGVFRAGLAVDCRRLAKPIELFDAGVRAEVHGGEHWEDVGVVGGEDCGFAKGVRAGDSSVED